MSLMGWPKIRAVPAVGKISLINNLMAVVFPAPFGPMNPKISPVSTRMFSPSSDLLFFRFKKPCGYSLVKFSVSIAGAVMSPFLAARAGPSILPKMECAGSGNRRGKQGRPVESGFAARRTDLHQFRLRCGRRHRHRLQRLRRAPVVEHADLLYAGNRAQRRAVLFRVELAVPHFRRVLFERYPRIPALLRTPVHQPILANIQIARARPASPAVGFPARHVMLKTVESRERPLAQRHDLFKNLDFARPKWLQLPVVVVDDSHRTGQPEVHGSARNA